MAAPRTIVVPAVKKHTATIICVHGLGDSGAGWRFLAQTFRQRSRFEDVAFIFPSAPNIPITVNRGMQMPGWYDIISFDTLNRTEDEPGIMKSREYLHGLVREEVEKKKIAPSRVILGGFSQGGAISLFSGLTYPQRLGGVFGLSCYQLLDKKFDQLREANEAAGAGSSGDADKRLKQPPVFMGHGQEDPLIKVQWGQMTRDGLKRRGFDVEWHEYAELPHSAAPEEIDQLEQWVEQRLEETKGDIPAGL